MINFEKLSDKDLYKYCKMVGFNAQKWHRRFIATLPEVARRRLYKKYGYCSIHEFAAKMAGVSRDNVDEVLRIDEKLKEMPKIKSLIGEKGLNKVRLVANIVKPETENFWAEKIQNMTKSSLRIYINEKFRSGTEGIKNVEFPQEQGQIGMFDSETFRSQIENESSPGGHRNKKTFTIQIDDETEFDLRKFKQQLEKERKEPTDWNSALKEMVKRATTEKMAGLKNSKALMVPEKQRSTPVSRYVPAKIKSDLLQKYNGHCAYTGCNKPSEQIHHPVRFAVRPNHENLIPLCKEHHDFIHQNSNASIDRIFNKFKQEIFVGGTYAG